MNVIKLASKLIITTGTFFLAPCLVSCTNGSVSLKNLRQWLSNTATASSAISTVDAAPTVTEGNWHQFTYPIYNDAGVKTSDSNSNLAVVRSFEFSHDTEKGMKHIAVSWLVANTDRIPTPFAWDNKYLRDKKGNLYSPSFGESTDVVQPNTKVTVPLILTYEVPDSIGSDGIQWGLFQASQKDLSYAISLQPKPMSTYESICSHKQLPDITTTQNGSLFPWQNDKTCIVYLLVSSESELQDDFKSINPHPIKCVEPGGCTGGISVTAAQGMFPSLTVQQQQVLLKTVLGRTPTHELDTELKGHPFRLVGDVDATLKNVPIKTATQRQNLECQVATTILLGLFPDKNGITDVFTSTNCSDHKCDDCGSFKGFAQVKGSPGHWTLITPHRYISEEGANGRFELLTAVDLGEGHRALVSKSSGSREGTNVQTIRFVTRFDGQEKDLFKLTESILENESCNKIGSTGDTYINQSDYCMYRDIKINVTKHITNGMYDILVHSDGKDSVKETGLSVIVSSDEKYVFDGQTYTKSSH